MKPRLYIPNDQNGDRNASDAEFVFKSICLDTGANDFDSTLAGFVQNGNVNIGGDGIVVVGGRKSISDAFGHIPVQNYRFISVGGQSLFFSYSRCAPGRGKVVDLAFQDAGNVFLGPINHLVTAIDKVGQKKQANPNTSWTVGRLYGTLMNSTYNPSIIAKKLEVYDEGLKKKTVVRIFSAAANFNGASLGPAVTGAGISLRLRQIFNV